MKQKNYKSILLSTLLCGGLLLPSGRVLAEEELVVFDMDPMVITAQRVDTKELDTPASIEIYDVEKIEKSGGANAYDVLKNTLGVITQSQGINGASMGTMTSKLMIRGIEKGTLVLVNGVSVNLDGKYSLDNIPSESIEKIEVVKGGGAVLYGSEATGGVVNIITKKKMPNKVSVAGGNYGKQRYGISLGADKFNISAGLERRGKYTPMSGPGSVGSTTVYDYKKGKRESILWNYSFNDALTFTHSYSENQNIYEKKNFKTGKFAGANEYKNRDNNFLLSYDRDGWKATAAYGIQEKRYDQLSEKQKKSLYSWRKGHASNFDLQKQFEVGKNKLLLGASYQKEDMDLIGSDRKSKAVVNSNLQRDIYSLYASYDIALNDRSNLYLNARETWAVNTKGVQFNQKTGKTTSVGNDDLSKFTPEAEYIYRIDDDTSVYAKVGKSFRLPNLTQYYGTGLIYPALDLKPEQGTHYEIGYKKNTGKSAWRFALFSYKIKDSIDASVTYDKKGNLIDVDYINEDVRNTGVEVSCRTEHDENWSSNFGLMFGNPQVRNSENYGDEKWHSFHNKYQINFGLNYKADKFTGSLAGNFVGDRTSSRASLTAAQRHIKPQFFTDMHLTYAPESNHKFYLHVNNIFDRLDITSNSTSNFYNLGRNFVLGYEMNF